MADKKEVQLRLFFYYLIDIMAKYHKIRKSENN